MPEKRKIAYFPGCKIPVEMPEDGKIFEALMQHLDVHLVKLPFYCCGYPARSTHFESSVFSAMKNMALAGKHGLDLLTPCKCCFGQFKHALYWYAVMPELKTKIDQRLKAENLEWHPEIRVFHMMDFLAREIGMPQIEQRIQNPLSDEALVVQYGCHALRPHNVTQFDHPENPGMFEQLIHAAGARVLPWSESLTCCGNPILETEEDLSMKILKNKLASARNTGAQSICMACTHCRIQYRMIDADPEIQPHGIRAEWLPALLSRAMGLTNRE